MSTTVFFGTPNFAVYVLEELEAQGIIPDIIVTSPDKPSGRGLKLKAPPVKKWAEERDIPVLQPHFLELKQPNVQPPEVAQKEVAQIEETEKAMDILLNSGWDVFLVAAYGKILPKNIIDLPARGVLNVHPSLLPRFRGAAPIESQILENEQPVGVSIMRIDEEMDHGPIVAQATVALEEWPLKASLLEELLAREGGRLLVEALPLWINKEIESVAQEHERATFTKKISKADGEINLEGDPYKNYLKYLAYDVWPGAYFFVEKEGKKMRVKITEAEYKNNTFTPLKVIPEGKKEIDFGSLQ